MKRHTLAKIGAAVGAVALVTTLASCSGGGSDEEASKTIKLGFIPSWTDGRSTAYLLEDQLGKLGYDVEMVELTDAGPLYTGLSKGDVDIYPSAWNERTHASYMEDLGENLEDLGAYYDNAKLTITVPSYVDIDSIDELKDNADMFGGEIIGIEPGAGLTKTTQESMIPEYGLEDDYKLITSSTAGMVTELDKAIKNEEPIVVTLWRPFWPYGTYDLKDLEDPKGAMGETEALHFLGREGFSEDYADVAELIAGIKLDDTTYGSLEDTVVNEHEEGDEPAAIDEWIDANPEAFETLIPNE